MKIIKNKISVDELKTMAAAMFGDFVKAVVDVERNIMAVDGELHADEEAMLIQDGSSQENLWGINIYPALSRREWIEFDSFINLRPGPGGNRTHGVDSPAVREKIIAVVGKLTSE